jgi:exodeoxyribonuclease VII large subunit
MPRRIGVVTSPSGAAVRDVLHVLRRRAPYVPVRIYPALVQGETAAADLCQALQAAARDASCDVLILTRGGGSLEDLAAFNDETLARRIAALPMPVISAVGHEIDFTIADFVADQRAPTPSAAAEIVAPDAAGLRERFDTRLGRLERAFRQLLAGLAGQLRELARRQQLAHPARRLRQQAQRVDEFDLRLARSIRQQLREAGRRADNAGRRLAATSPANRLRLARERAGTAHRRLQGAMERTLAHRQQALRGLARSLHAVSPLGTLSRGYAIARRHEDGSVLHAAAEAPPGTRVDVLLDQGRLECVVERIVSDGGD